MCAGTLICIIARHLVMVIGRYLDPLEKPATNYCARKDVLQLHGQIGRLEASDHPFGCGLETRAAFDQALRKLQS